MNLRRLPALLVLATCCLTVVSLVRATDENAGKPAALPKVNVCIVSGEPLKAGEIVVYVHKEPGKPDRQMRFCCRKCLARFKADPARFLKKLDQLESGKKN